MTADLAKALTVRDESKICTAMMRSRSWRIRTESTSLFTGTLDSIIAVYVRTCYIYRMTS